MKNRTLAKVICRLIGHAMCGPSCQRCGFDSRPLTEKYWRKQIRKAEEEAIEALRDLRINANRLCDRNLGGTYEEDCRRSIARADAVLSAALVGEGSNKTT